MSLVSFTLSFLATILVLVASAEQDGATSLTKFDHYVKPPVSNIHTGGRLTERQIGYIANSKYASILSVVEFSTNDTSYNGVSGSFPSSAYERQIAQSYGLVSNYVVSSLTVEALNVISKLIEDSPKPLFIHCHVGYTATLFTELYLYGKGVVKSSAELYANGLKYGYDYLSNKDVVNFVNIVTGSNDSVQPESIEQTLASGEASYKSYFWVHRTGGSDYWYNVGQILDTHIGAIATAGYKTVISFRDNGEATNRLSTDPSTGAVDNNEFSDLNGNYDAAAEKSAVEASGLTFNHLPMNSGATDTWTTAQFNLYLPTLMEAEARGPVLSHCASGYRSSTYVLAYLALKNSHCTEWAIEKSREIGIVLDSAAQSSTDKQVINFFHEVLKC